MFNSDYGSSLLQIDDLQRELERTTAGASEHALHLEKQLEEVRRLAEQRATEIVRLAVQQQPPSATDSAAEIAELKRQLEATQEV